MSDLDSPVLRVLRDLDPVRDRPAVTGSPDDPELHRILTTDRTPSPDDRVPRRTPITVLTGAALGGVVVAAAAAVLLTLDTTPAYASWTPVPLALTEAQQAERAEACPAVAHLLPDEADAEVEVVEVPLETVLVEARGQYTYVLAAAEGAYAECFVIDDPRTEDWDVAESVGNEMVLGAGAVIEDAPVESITVLANGTSVWAEGAMGDGALTSAFGRVGDEVRELEVTTTSGERVVATVENGWWAVWAPGSEALRDEATVTLEDGSTVEVSLAERPTG